MTEWNLQFLCNREKEEKVLKNDGLALKLDRVLDFLRFSPADVPPGEVLRGDFKGYRSRRINRKHRVVFRIDGESHTVFIVQLCGHYND